MTKNTRIIMFVLGLLVGGIYLFFGKQDVKADKPSDDYCTTETTELTKEQFTKCAAQQFGKKFDRIEKEEMEAKKKAEDDARNKKWRAVQNISETDAQGSGFIQ